MPTLAPVSASRPHLKGINGSGHCWQHLCTLDGVLIPEVAVVSEQVGAVGMSAAA